MDITYVARHGGHDNDDEGAIAHALEQLGHRVTRLSERASVADIEEIECDFVLCHRWERFDVMSKVSRPIVFWYFDLLVGDYDARLRLRFRRAWAGVAASLCHTGFCTDGDWVKFDRTGKLFCLRQGADERVVGKGESPQKFHKLLFTGIVAGSGRREHIQRLSERYSIHIVGGNGYKGRVHGRRLANLIASSEVVIAPIAPVTDYYWSNRVYLTLGFEGFLLHPCAHELAVQYEPDRELVVYKTVDESMALIDHYLDHPEKREEIARAGYERTINEHLYRHRCAELIRTVRERL